MRQFAEYLESAIDLFTCQILQPLRAKSLHRKRSHHPAIEECPLQHFAIHLSLRGDVAHESARKRIARSRRILHFVDGQRRRSKWMPAHSKRSLAEENRRSVFSVLDDQC